MRRQAEKRMKMFMDRRECIMRVTGESFVGSFFAGSLGEELHGEDLSTFRTFRVKNSPRTFYVFKKEF
jgi:hypothetical protein